MDNHGTTRPSLVAGSGRGARLPGPGGRILADMENRRPAHAPAAPGNRARWLLLAAGVLAVICILATAARLVAPGSADPWRARGTGTVGHADPSAQAPAIPPAPQPAVIIDDPPARSDASGMGDATAATRIVTAEAPRPEPSSAGRSGPGPKTATRTPQALAAISPRAASADADGGLLATLLGIIHRDESAQPTHASMDELVAHILAENGRAHSQTSAALASIGGQDAPSARPSRAARALANCPAANTPQGIHCRDRVCARWAGRDPVCPAR